MATLRNSVIGGQYMGCSPGGGFGTMFGCCALANASGYAFNNVAFGVCALRNMNSGDYNVAVGYKALNGATTGNGNTAAGYLAGCTTTTGNCNTFLGYKTYLHSTAGSNSRNTAIGVCTLRSLSGNDNTAIGFCAQTTTGTNYNDKNTAIGFKAGFQTVGSRNVTIGSCTIAYGKSVIIGCGRCNETCNNHTAIGFSGGGYGGGIESIALGYKTCARGLNNIAIGACINQNNNYHIQWGNSSNNVKNCIWPTWTSPSDQRDKANIQSLDSKYGIEFIKKLKSKTFNWDNRETYVRECGFEFGQKDGTLSNSEERYGFIAQEIKETIDELGIRFDALGGEKNDAYRLASGAFIAPMIKTIQEISERLELLDEEVTKLETL